MITKEQWDYLHILLLIISSFPNTQQEYSGRKYEDNDILDNEFYIQSNFSSFVYLDYWRVWVWVCFFFFFFPFSTTDISLTTMNIYRLRPWFSKPYSESLRYPTMNLFQRQRRLVSCHGVFPHCVKTCNTTPKTHKTTSVNAYNVFLTSNIRSRVYTCLTIWDETVVRLCCWCHGRKKKSLPLSFK